MRSQSEALKGGVSAGRLLICCVNYAPEILGTAPYTRDLAHWFAARGWDVRVVTTYPYYPEWLQRRGDPRFAYRVEVGGGVTVVRCPSWIPAVPTGVKRLAHYASFAASSLPVILGHAAWRPALVLVVAPTLVVAPVALLAAHFSGGNSWLHIQDYEVEVALRLGLLPPAGSATLKWVESRLLRAFDVVSSITLPMLDVARELGVSADKLVLLPNWANLALVRPLGRPSRFRVSLGISDGTPVVLYTGNLGRKQGVALLGEAARHSQESGSRVVYVVSGDGADSDALAATAAAHGLANLVRVPLQPDESFNELLNLADMHLIVQEAGVADLVMPSKLTNMLASGRPVIATASAGTALAELIRRHDVGEVVMPGDSAAVAEAVTALMTDDERRLRQGANARAFAEAYLDRDRLMEEAVSSLNQRWRLR
jgi:putative colanic acid biosynthesis glycosyltransferase WcaI